MPLRDRAFFERMRRHDPDRTPDQRWKEALRIVAEHRRVSARRDGPELIRAVDYQRAMARCRTERGRDGVRRRFPDLHEAALMVQAGGPALDEIKARILAGQSDAEIAARCRVSAGAVQSLESLFFETRASVKAHDWIISKVIGPAYNRANPGPNQSAIWLSAGYHAGPLYLEAVLAVSKNEPFPESIQPTSSPVDLLFAARLRKSIKIAIDVELMPPDVDPRFLFRLHLRLIAEKKPSIRVKSIIERIDDSLAEIPIRRTPIPTTFQLLAAGA